VLHPAVVGGLGVPAVQAVAVQVALARPGVVALAVPAAPASPHLSPDEAVLGGDRT
jgi:hypothetical protein